MALIENAPDEVVIAEKKIVSFLDETPNGMTPPELIAKVSEDAKILAADVRDALWRLVAEGQLQLADNMKLVHRREYPAQK